MSEKILPRDVTNIDVVFGNISGLMPERKSIPDEFKDQNRQTRWNEIVAQWFFRGLPQGTSFKAKDGIDPQKAIRHIKTILGSYEPKHEHKEATCAYLLSLWFDDIATP